MCIATGEEAEELDPIKSAADKSAAELERREGRLGR
jgi:hypothetical protein